MPNLSRLPVASTTVAGTTVVGTTVASTTVVRKTLARAALALALVFLPAATVQAADHGSVGPNVPKFTVRKGYKVTLAAENFGQARFMVFDDAGTLYVSQPNDGKIVSLKDTDGDGVYETKADFLTNYPQVHSMCFADGWLYATSADDGSCRRARDTNGDGKADDTEVFLKPGTLPAKGGHPFRGIAINDKNIYITVSDPQNMSDDLPSDRKCIYVFDRDGKNKRQFITGIRNTEKLQFRPGTSDLYGVDHGTDWFGKEYGDKRNDQPITNLLPGEELNKFTDGAFYGHPFLSNNRIVRPEYAGRRDINDLAAKNRAAGVDFWGALGG